MIYLRRVLPRVLGADCQIALTNGYTSLPTRRSRKTFSLQKPVPQRKSTGVKGSVARIIDWEMCHGQGLVGRMIVEGCVVGGGGLYGKIVMARIESLRFFCFVSVLNSIAWVLLHLLYLGD